MAHWSPEIANCFHPFGQEEGEAELHLQQQSDRDFTLTSGFTYKCGDSRAIHLGPGLLKETDLASVPSSMRWMVGSYGRHTFAALLHDALIRGVATTLRPLPKGPGEKRVAIDAIFFRGFGLPGSTQASEQADVGGGHHQVSMEFREPSQSSDDAVDGVGDCGYRTARLGLTQWSLGRGCTVPSSSAFGGDPLGQGVQGWRVCWLRGRVCGPTHRFWLACKRCLPAD